MLSSEGVKQPQHLVVAADICNSIHTFEDHEVHVSSCNCFFVPNEKRAFFLPFAGCGAMHRAIFLFHNFPESSIWRC